MDAILSQLSREEKASLLAGIDDWYLHGIPRLGIPSIRVTDCGHGVTLCGERSSPATCFPTGIGMASTWNEPLLEQAGHILGRETRALDCSILLGPKISLHRTPVNGRSFETFSEDPWLAGLLGAAVIRGIQAEGVGACVKAMAANNQQQDQGTVSVEIDERTARELYLRAFQLAVEFGHPCAIMTAYNRLNGDYCAESRWLIEQVIKKEWKFPGLVVSDWNSVHSSKVFQSGLDLEMPGPAKFFNKEGILHALTEGLLTDAELDDKAGRILNAIVTFGPEHTHSRTGLTLDTKESRATALAVAEESIVLLKNEGGLLPLDKRNLKKLLVVGPNAAEARLGGGGSASVTPFYAVSPLQGIREICGSEVEVSFIEGCNLVGTMECIRAHFTHEADTGERLPGLRAEFFNSRNPGGPASAAWTVPQIDFSWGWATPGPRVDRVMFSVRFSGWLTPPVSGRYRLGLYSQEGCVSLEIDHQPAVKQWDKDDGNFEEQFRSHYSTVEREWIKDVPVYLEICYAKRAARAGVRLEWGVPGAHNPLDKVVEASRTTDAVIVCAGLSNLLEGGGMDRPNIDLSKAQRQLIEAISSANPRTVVVLFNGGPLAMPWEHRIAALIEAWYPGQEGGRALARILFGLTNPSGRLPDTLGRKLEDHASSCNYPGDGDTLAYKEELFVGYRHFDSAGIEPHYPFGFGLSYTSFEIESPVADTREIAPGGRAVITTNVKNTGARCGKLVVQLYVRPIDPPLPGPVKALRAFRKVSLAPGEKAEIAFSLGPRELEFFDAQSGTWRVAPGDYEILAGEHSRSLKAVTISVKSDE